MSPPASRTNPSPITRQLIEREALAKKTIERLEYKSDTGHLTTEFVGDIGVFLGQFRPPVSQRVRGFAKKGQK